jgi:hypothetical protein
MPAAIAVPLITTAAGAGASIYSSRKGAQPGEQKPNPWETFAPMVGAGINAGASIYGAHKTGKAQTDAARYQQAQANYAADLEAKAAAEALAFAKEQEAARHAEWKTTQDRNYAIYVDDRTEDRRRYDDQVARREPFRKFAVGAQRQLSRPIYQAGTIGSLIGR